LGSALGTLSLIEVADKLRETATYGTSRIAMAGLAPGPRVGSAYSRSVFSFKVGLVAKGGHIARAGFAATFADIRPRACDPVRWFAARYPFCRFVVDALRRGAQGDWRQTIRGRFDHADGTIQDRQLARSVRQIAKLTYRLRQDIEIIRLVRRSTRISL
jgi:hypothetical protein